MILKNNKSKICQSNRNQNGNAIIFLFAAISMAGTVAYGLNNVMRGPGVTATEISRKSIAENNLIATSRLAVVATTAQLGDNADCDGDGFIEPLPYRAAGGLPHPAGGGLVPMTLGASISDPWGTQYGYCVWDHGTVSVSNAHPACGGATPRRLQGAPTDNHYAISVISAGKDGIFQTTCNAYVDTTPADGIPDTPLVNTPNGSDDIVLSYTYAEANGISGGVWKLKDGDADTAVTNKNVEAAGGATFTDGPLTLQNRGLVLPGDPGNDSVTGACDEAKDQQMRRNIGDGSSTPTIEICDYTNSGGWIPLGTGLTYGGKIPDQEIQKIIADDGSAGDYFSISIDASDQTLVIGVNENKEAAYIYNKMGDSWVFQQKLTGSDTVSGDRFGRAVAISGDMMAISAPLDDDGGTDTGSVYIFKNVAGTWTQVQRLVTSDRGNNDQVGHNLVMQGHTLLVGVSRDDDINSNAGAIYVFNRTGDVWSQAQKLTPADLGANDNMGTKISLSGNILVAGVAPHNGSAGAAYVYTKSAGTWSLTTKLLPQDPAAGSLFGSSVGIYGQTILIGSSSSSAGGTNRGAAYIFENEGGTWQEAQKLVASDAADSDRFGYTVELGENIALISAVAASPSAAQEGKVYIFSIVGGEWTERKILTVSDPAASGFMGRSLLLRNGQALIGSYNFDTPRGVDAGALYVFAPSTAEEDTVLRDETRPMAVEPLDQGLVAHWKMDEGTGTAVRDSVGSNHGTFANTPQWVEGVQGSSGVAFNQSLLSHVSVDGMMGMPQQLTWAGWVNLEKYSSAASHFFNIGKCWAIAARSDFGVYATQDKGGGSYDRTITNYNIAGKGWKYIVATADDPNNIFRVYIDGILIKEETFTSPIAWNNAGCTGSQGKTSMGSAYNTSTVEFPMHGALDDIRFYNRAIGPAEVSELTKRAMNESSVRQKPGLTGSPGNFSGKITASTDHTCGIKPDGTAWCWGLGTHGRLGHGSTSNSTVPVRVLNPGPWGMISAGNSHTCGIKTDGSAWCWGNGAEGRLGNGAINNSSIPVEVSGGSLWSSIAAADNHTCGIKLDGTAWCWGYAGSGQLGNGTTNNSSIPVEVSGSSLWRSIRVGASLTCGLKTDNTAWCWGSGLNGRLGNGDTTNQLAPVAVSGNRKWSYLGTGTGADMACAIEENGGAAWCWGMGANGRLGNGTTVDTNIPTKVLGEGIWTSIVPGDSHTCGIQIDGSAWCWSQNTAGRLGVGGATGATYTRPQRVIIPDIMDTVSIGLGHTCGMSVDGRAYCWGEDSSGKLGDGLSVPNVLTPYPVFNWMNPSPWSWNDTFSTIMLQGNHTLGLNGNWMSDDGTSQKYFGFEGAGRAVIRQNNTHNQLLIDTTAAASSAQINFRAGRQATPSVLPAGFLSWNFDEGTGNTTASGGGGSAGTLSGSYTWNTTDEGSINNKRTLEFSGGRAQLNRAAWSEPAQLSWSVWINPNGMQSEGTTVLSKTHSNNTGTIKQSYGIQFGQENQIQFVTGHAAGNDILVGPKIKPNAWTNIVVVYNPAGTAPQKRLYVNGVLSASKTYTQALAYDTTATGHLYYGAAGCASLPCQGFNGTVERFLLYQSELSDAQVYDLYKQNTAIISATTHTIGFHHGAGSLNISRNNAGASSAIDTLTPDFLFTSNGRAAIGQSTANTLVDVAGGVKLGYQAACTAANAGTIRNDLGSHYECTNNHNNFIARASTSQNWWGITSSADGSKLAAVVATSGQIYTSTDSGLTWTARESLRDWRGIASSADGVKLAAVAQGGQIYTSTDSGVTWVPRESVRAWTSVASSADGSKLVATVNNGQIYTSIDSGVTWTARDSDRAWYHVASSADGVKLVAATVGAQIYTSTDSGATWIARDSNRNWVNVASSADGAKLVAVEQGGQIYTSIDSGVTWTARDSVRVWRGVASSADGTKLVASAFGGALFTSIDSGLTWIRKDSTRNWREVTSSADGSKIAAVVQNSQIYTSNTCAWKTGYATPQQTAMLVPNDPQASSNFSADGGRSLIAQTENMAIIGAYLTDGGNGAAYVFENNNGTWAQTQKIVPADIGAGDNFGHISNISNDTIMIGARLNDTGASNGGAVYVYTRSGGTWIQTQKLTPSDPTNAKFFGVNPVIDGNRAVIGAIGENSSTGAIYVFEKENGLWVERQKIIPTGAATGDSFSARMSLSGGLLVTNAPNTNSNAGAIYIFERVGGIWAQVQRMEEPVPAANNYFGFQVAIAGNDILASMIANGGGYGAVYVIQKTGGTWGISQTLHSTDNALNDRFGVGLSVQNDTALIAAVYDDDFAADSGSAYIFKRSGGIWYQADKFTANALSATDLFGRGVSIYKDRAIVGSQFIDTVNGADRGAAYVFEGVGANPNPAQPFKYCDGTEWKELPIAPGTTAKAKRGSGSFSAGRSSSCYIGPDGAAWCWGFASVGQLGNGHVTAVTKPVKVVKADTWKSVTVGHLQACGITADGTAWCWGSNVNGRLGDGTTDNKLTPTLITGNSLWNKISTSAFSCGIQLNGSAWCWGGGANGQMGNGTLTATNTTPVELSGGYKWIDISTGQNSACGIQIDGTAWCWGNDGNGKLGNGPAGNQLTPFQVTGIGSWKKIAVGPDHSCGIKTDGTAWCWGRGLEGQMGNGTTTATNHNPVQVTSATGWHDITVSEYTGGTEQVAHSCGIKVDGTAWCWGSGTNGQMGNGTTTAINSTPVQVGGTGPWIGIDAGPDYACGQKADATLWCWGSGINMGTANPTLNPTQVVY